MADIYKVMQILGGSKQYEFDGTILTITGYYTGEEIKLDLGKLDEEMIEALQPDEDDVEDDYYE